MLMHDPPHPGEVVRRQCLEPLGLSVTEAREHYGDSKKKWKRRDYVRRTVGKALEKAEPEHDEDAETRVLIKIEPGQMPSIIRNAAAALGQATLTSPFDGVYRHGNRLVLVTRRVDKPDSEQQGDVK